MAPKKKQNEKAMSENPSQPATTSNTVIVLRLDGSLRSDDMAKVYDPGFSELLTKHANGHAQWMVLRTPEVMPRVDKSLDPCIEALRRRGCTVETHTMEGLASDAHLVEAALKVRRLLETSHVFICTRSGHRERLVAEILRHAFEMQKPPTFVVSSSYNDSGYAYILSAAAVPTYEKATDGKKATSEPNPNHRVTVRLLDC